jgi:hypothetical protein
MKILDFIKKYGTVGLAQLLPVESLLGNGNIWFVDSSVTGCKDSIAFEFGNGWEAPFKTLDYAIGRCTASQGDVILVGQGHTGSLATAGAITCDVADITIVGMGKGVNRPTFSWTATIGTWVISAANVTIKNIRTQVTTTDEIVKMFNVTGAHCTLDKVDFTEYSVDYQAINFLTTSNAADYFTMKNCTHYNVTAAATAGPWIDLKGMDRPTIVDNKFFMTLPNSASAFVIGASTAFVMGEVARNVIHQTGGTTQDYVISVSTSTGFFYDNRLYGNVGTLAGMNASTSAAQAENYAESAVGKSGVIDPVKT